MEHTHQAAVTSTQLMPAADEAAPVSLDQLSRRERQVLDLLFQGLRAWQIAGKLEISERTVKSHKKNLLDKMKVRSVLQLALMVPRT